MSKKKSKAQRVIKENTPEIKYFMPIQKLLEHPDVIANNLVELLTEIAEEMHQDPLTRAKNAPDLKSAIKIYAEFGSKRGSEMLEVISELSNHDPFEADSLKLSDRCLKAIDAHDLNELVETLESYNMPENVAYKFARRMVNKVVPKEDKVDWIYSVKAGKTVDELKEIESLIGLVNL